MQRGYINTTALAAILIVLIVIMGLLLALSRAGKENALLSISSFEDCAAAGYPIMETYPEQCRTPDGRLFAKQIHSAPQNSDTASSSSSHPPVPSGVQPAY